VFKCLSRDTGQVVAIKRYHELEEENMMMKKMAYREIRSLKVWTTLSAFI
jgi:microcompartment protein CcmK/EutM